MVYWSVETSQEYPVRELGFVDAPGGRSQPLTRRDCGSAAPLLLLRGGLARVIDLDERAL